MSLVITLQPRKEEWLEFKSNNGDVIKIQVRRHRNNQVRLHIEADKKFKIVRKHFDGKTIVTTGSKNERTKTS